MAKQNTRTLLEKIKAGITELLENPPVNEFGESSAISPKDLSSLATTIIQIYKLENEEEKRAQEAEEKSGGSRLGMHFPPMPIISKD